MTAPEYLPGLAGVSGRYVHRSDLGIAFGESPAPKRCRALFARQGAMPDHVVPTFRW